MWSRASRTPPAFSEGSTSCGSTSERRLPRSRWPCGISWRGRSGRGRPTCRGERCFGAAFSSGGPSRRTGRWRAWSGRPPCPGPIGGSPARTRRPPAIDPATWRLTVQVGATVKQWSYAELLPFDDRVRATLDCTGGWFSQQDWEGVLLWRLLGDAGEARSVGVGSLTGYGRRFPVPDARGLLLATRVGGQPLSAGHGAPVRLVAPGRRGFWWVKWVDRIEVGSTLWWWQWPLPLT
ncbi:MAG: hypothetical protein E6G52_09735 [Actinobacteria bacterium]|nr:MAG: hypothetical protein E6G52_09735 [Actinomycetota bacterium]